MEPANSTTGTGSGLSFSLLVPDSLAPGLGWEGIHWWLRLELGDGCGFRYVVVSYPTWACSLLLVGSQQGWGSIRLDWEARGASTFAPWEVTQRTVGELGCQRGASVPKPPALREQRMEETSVTATHGATVPHPCCQRAATAPIAAWSVTEQPRSARHSGWACSPPRHLGWGRALAADQGRALASPHVQGGSRWCSCLHEQERELGLTAGTCGCRRGPGCYRGPIGPREQLRSCYANLEEPGNQSEGRGA